MKKFQIVKPFWKLLIQLCFDRALRFYTIRGHLSVPVSSIHVFHTRFPISLCFPYMFVSWGLLWNVQAMQGRYLPLAVVYHKDYEHAKRAFLLYHKLFVARGIVYALFMLLPFFEVSSISEYAWFLLARGKLFHIGCGCNFVRPRSSKFLIVSGLASDNWPHFLWHAVIVFPFLGTSLVPWKNAKPVWWSKDISSQRFAVYSATNISFDSGT